MTFSKNQKAKHIFKQWEASLSERDRSVASLKDNFSDLFYEFDKNGIEFDVASSYLDPAIAAHLPSRSVVKHTYRKFANKAAFDSEDDFLKSWKEMIKNAATNCFYAFYPVTQEQPDQMPNGMSKSEYNKQRRYAESFPLINVHNLPDLEDQLADLSIEDLEL